MDVSGTTVIGRPVDVVFDYVQDPSNDANWRIGLDESGWQSGESPGPGAIGYTLAGNARVEWRVISYAPGESIEWEFISGPLQGRAGYRLEPVDGGTQFTLVGDVEPAGCLKLAGPLFGRMVRRQNQTGVERLRDILESTPDLPGQG